MNRPTLVLLAGVLTLGAAAPALADDAYPPPKPHVGFYVIHPRVALSTYFSLSSSWAGTQAPIRVVAKIHPAGETCGADVQSDTGKIFSTASLERVNHHTVWKEWTPTTAGSFVVCTWLGDPARATGSTPLVVAPRIGSLVAAMTSKTPNGPARAVFPTAPRNVYARFALRGVKRGVLITIVFRDTNGKSVVTHTRSKGPALAWYSTHIDHHRIEQRLGYWIVGVRVGGKTLGQIHFIVPSYER
jgi:hypothetical protein